MTITTACLLDGNPDYEQVAQAVGSLLGVEVEVEQPLAQDDTMFLLKFPDPEAAYYTRRMSVILRAKEPSVSPDELTRCSFYGEGRVTEILAAIALHFGGWISVDTDADHWTQAKRVAPAVPVALSPIDELNQALRDLLPVSSAVEMRRVVSDDGKFDTLLSALTRYGLRKGSAREELLAGSQRGGDMIYERIIDVDPKDEKHLLLLRTAEIQIRPADVDRPTKWVVSTESMRRIADVNAIVDVYDDITARLTPLEWRQFSDRGDLEATTIVGVYKVRPSSSKPGRFRLYVPGGVAEDAPFHSDAEAAKLGAWNHYRKTVGGAF